LINTNKKILKKKQPATTSLAAANFSSTIFSPARSASFVLAASSEAFSANYQSQMQT